jgi:aminoglycoside N3'-acetyltransferase
MEIALEVTAETIRKGINHAGLSGRPVCVHSSLRSFGRIFGGASAVVDAFLAEGCTLVVPTFTYRFMISSKPGMRPTRNGMNYDNEGDSGTNASPVYSSELSEVHESMGKLPAAIAAGAGRVRGNHPTCSFSAVGPLAGPIIEGQGPTEVYAPMRKLMELDGSCVLMGVGLDRLTLLHYAEQVAGRNMLRRWANDSAGKPMMVEMGACSDGFERLRPALAGLLATIRVGSSVWTVVNADAAVRAAAAAIERDPSITSCNNSECERCRDMAAGGPILDF